MCRWWRVRRTAPGFRVLRAIDDPVDQPAPAEHFGAAPDDRVEAPEAVRPVAEPVDA